jgi:hypothetical protein
VATTDDGLVNRDRSVLLRHHVATTLEDAHSVWSNARDVTHPDHVPLLICGSSGITQAASGCKGVALHSDSERYIIRERF